MTERFLNYQPPISSELKNEHELALAGEMRWQGGLQFSDIEESNFDHVASMFEIHTENSIKYPLLFSEVNVPEAEHMIYIHDTGEIGGLDLPHSVPNYKEVREGVKKRERANFRLITKKYIEDVELKAYVRNLYRRYDKCEPNDRVAQYVHLIDKIQANRFGAVHVFPARKLRKEAERLQQVNHIYGITINYAKNLMRTVGGEAQEELLEFMDKEISVLRDNGYRASEVDPYRKKIREELVAQRELIRA